MRFDKQIHWQRNFAIHVNKSESLTLEVSSICKTGTFVKSYQILFTKGKNCLLSGILMFIANHHKIILSLSYFIQNLLI